MSTTAENHSGPNTISSQLDHGVVGLRTEPLLRGDRREGQRYVVWQDCRFRSGCSANDIDEHVEERHRVVDRADPHRPWAAPWTTSFPGSPSTDDLGFVGIWG